MSSRSRHNPTAAKTRAQLGASYTELVIIMPLMMLFLYGLAWAGRMFSEMIPFSKIAYETTRVGGDSTALYGLSAMDYRFDQLFNNTYNANNDLRMSAAGVGVDTAYSGGQVSFKSSGEARSINDGFLPTQFKMNYTAQVLESHADTAGLTGTDNADCGYYDCNGNCSISVLTEPCPVTPPANEQGQGGGGGGGSYGCFAAGTPIRMADGTEKAIDTIGVGDLVLAVDFERSDLVAASVIDLMRFVRNEYFVLNGALKVSAEHPFFSRGEWVKAGDLKIGDELLGESGERVILASKVLVIEKIEVFNITVEGVHNYFAGGVLVHNKNTPGIGQVGDKQTKTD